MTYIEFDNKYNKRNTDNVILNCSIIDLDGNIIFNGTLNEVETYWDDHVEPVWVGHKVITMKINGKEAITTNLPKGSHFFNKLHFEVN